MKLTEIYADSIVEGRCQGRQCYAPVWFAVVVGTGRPMPFNEKPVAMEVQPDMFGEREVWLVDLDRNHWATCPNASDFRERES